MSKNIKALKEVSNKFVDYLFALSMEPDPFDESKDELIAEVSSNYESYLIGHSLYMALTDNPIDNHKGRDLTEEEKKELIDSGYDDEFIAMCMMPTNH